MTDYGVEAILAKAREGEITRRLSAHRSLISRNFPHRGELLHKMQIVWKNILKPADILANEDMINLKRPEKKLPSN